MASSISYTKHNDEIAAYYEHQAMLRANEAKASEQNATKSASDAAAIINAIPYTTKALMDADLNHPAGTWAKVINDATASNDGFYAKQGASGSGSWQKDNSVVNLPDRSVTGAKIGVDAVSSPKIIDGAVLPHKTSFFRFGKNLFDKASVTTGYVVNEATGAIYANASYNVSDYIPITGNTDYTENKSYYLAYYDADKTFISGLGAGSPASNPRTITTPVNAKFIRLSVHDSVLNTFQFELGTAVTTYEPYIAPYLDTDNIVKEKSITNEMLDDLAVSVGKTDFVTFGKNLFNKESATTGYVVNELTGAIYANANYDASDYIDVDSSTTYTASTGYYQAYYDVNKVFISGLGAAATPSSPRTFTTPSTAKFIRASCHHSSGGKDTFQLEEGAESTTYENFGYKFTKEITTASPESFIPELKLPPTIYALVGQELNIYFDNIFNAKDTDYDWDVVCSIGTQYDNFFRTTPNAAGNYSIVIKALKNNIELASTTSTIKVIAVGAGSGVNRKILVIGDSTTANGIALSKLNANFDTDVMDITFIGTKGTNPNKHEGISGWTINQWYTDPTSSFVFSGAFNFAQYMATNGFSGLNYVFINLGINDTFGYLDDTSLNTKIATMLTQLQGMIDSIHAYDANIKIGLAVTIPPCYDQAAFGKMYGNSFTRWRYKRNNYIWAKALIDQFKNKEAQLIYLVPINTNIDTRYNFGLETLPVNARNSTDTFISTIANGNVHPEDSGYWQIADVYWYFLKSFEI